MKLPTPVVRKARAVSGFVDSLRVCGDRVCGVVRFESPNGKPLAVALIPVVCHGDRWLLRLPDGGAEPRPVAADIRPSLGRLGHVVGDTVAVDVPWPQDNPGEALLLLLHAQVEDIGDPEFALAAWNAAGPPRPSPPPPPPGLPGPFGLAGAVERRGWSTVGTASAAPPTALTAAIARCLMRRPASELDLAVLRRPRDLVSRRPGDLHPSGPVSAVQSMPTSTSMSMSNSGSHSPDPAPSPGRSEARAAAFALGSCQFPAGILDGSVNLRHAVRSDADIGPADRALWRLAGRCEADPSIEALILTGDLVYVDATAGLFDPKAQEAALEFAYARLRDNHALDRIKRLGVSIYTLMDDHEIRDDYGGEPGQIEAARHHFLRAQRVMWPGPAYRTGMPLWATREVAGHPVFLADTRSERTQRSLANWRDATLCSPTQMAALLRWIARESRRAGPAFVVTPSMLLPRPLKMRNHGDAMALQVDAWCGYPASLHRLLAWIHDRRAGNLVFLSGDEHLSSIVRITLSDPASDRAPVVIHSIHSSALYAPFPFANSRAEDFAAPDCFKFKAGGRAGPRSLSCRVEVLDWIPGDGHALIRPIPPATHGQPPPMPAEPGAGVDPGLWHIEVDFDRAPGASRRHGFSLPMATAASAFSPGLTPSA